jgi:two-component system OmpR family sensor kinase
LSYFSSVQFRLSMGLAIAILLVAVLAGAFSFRAAYEDTRELQDDVLRQVAELMSRRHLAPDPSDAELQFRPENEDSRLIVQRLGSGSASRRELDNGGVLPLPLTLPDGLQTHRVDGETFRILVKTLPGGERIVVAQEEGYRKQIAFGGAMRTVLPFLVLVPLLLLIVAQLVRRMFQPIAALSREIEGRGAHDLTPVEAGHLPQEVRPFALAINQLLGKASQSIEAQRRFVADAAHELRSPLTALSLQAERLAEAEMSTVAQQRLVTLRQGIERGRRLLDQLLALARAHAQVAPAASPSTAPTSVLAVYRRVLEDLMPLAEAKHLDIGIEGGQDALLTISELDLQAIVKNLVDNAIRYTPAGGKVDLSVAPDAEGVVLSVSDSGPGIAPEERERVFDPFYRSLGTEQLGSGLGLSIVKTIAERVGARVVLAYANEEQRYGLRISVCIHSFSCRQQELEPSRSSR